MTLKPGDVVRPVVTIASLDARRMYRVVHVESPSPFACNVYLEDASSGIGLLAPIEHGNVVLEPVRSATLKPSTALFN
jgi:hypothetical protein